MERPSEVIALLLAGYPVEKDWQRAQVGAWIVQLESTQRESLKSSPRST